MVEQIWRFDFSRDHTTEMLRDVLGGAPSSWFSTIPSSGSVDLVNVDTKRFDLTDDHVIDVSGDVLGKVLSS